MQKLSTRQLVNLVFLTLIWGLNWPVMKQGITGYPPLTFRTISMLAGLPLLALILVALKVPFRIPRRHWPELALLTVTNMLVWHVCMILALKYLSSGRAAILGYTMPIFSAVLGALVFSSALTRRNWAGVGAAALGVTLLLWHELTALAGRPIGVLLALFAAAVWALGVQLLRRTHIDAPTLTLTFWMTAGSTLGMSVGSVLFERQDWTWPSTPGWWAIAYNAVLIFGYANAAWFYLARSLPPIASTLSVMLIPVLGVLSGALWLGEVLHWQDYTAVLLMMVAIASVLWPAGGLQGRPEPLKPRP
jgi:drug/metabolite transporter (DMT)-like permease